MSETDEDPRTSAICQFFTKVFFSVTNPPEGLSDLCDGVVMFEALSEISMDHFDPTTVARDLGENWALKATNLKKLLRNLEEFYHEELQKDSDFESISAHINPIARGEDLDNIVAFVELIAVAVTSCEDKDVFVSRMMEMDREMMGELQEIIQDAYKVVTDFDTDNAGEEGDADSLVFEGGGNAEGIPASPTVLFPSHGDTELSKERDQLRQALQDSQRELGQAKSQAAIDEEDNQKEKAKLRALNEDLQDRLVKRERDLAIAEHSISKYKRTLDETQTEVIDLREKSASLADELDIEKSKVLGLRKSEAMVEVYRKKLDSLHSTNQQMGGMEDQTAKYVEEIMHLENENKKIPSLRKQIEDSHIQVKKLESRISEAEEALNSKDVEVNKLKNDASSAEKAKKMYHDELKELRAQHEDVADAALEVNGSQTNYKAARLELENSKLKGQIEQMQSGVATAVPVVDQDRVAALEKKLTEKDVEVSKLVTDKEKLEAYTKKTLQKFQEKYLVALQDCKAKLKEKHDKIESLEMRGASEKSAQKREEKLMSSAIFELGMGIMSNRLGKR